MPESSLLDANAILAAKGKSFHWARHFLGKNHAQRATRLYRLCRYIDDIADEHQGIPQAFSVLSEIKTAFATGISSDPIIKDGLLLLEEC
jgi:phytoene synthase